MKFKVDYFKKSGKWYDECEFTIPHHFIYNSYIMKNNLIFHSQVIHEFREWAEKTIVSNEFIAIPNITAGVIDDLFGFPMMVMPE